MPSLPDVPNVVKTVIRSSYQGNNNINNILYWKANASVNAAVLGELVAQVGIQWISHILPQLSNKVQLLSVKGTDLSSTSGAQVESPTPGTGGNTASIALPVSTSFVVSQHIVRRYRGGHSRIYICGLPADSDNTSQIISGVVRAAFEAAFESFYEAVKTHSYTGITSMSGVSVSYFQGFTNVTGTTGREKAVAKPRAVPVVDEIISCTVEPWYGTQRRRERYGK